MKQRMHDDNLSRRGSDEFANAALSCAHHLFAAVPLPCLWRIPNNIRLFALVFLPSCMGAAESKNAARVSAAALMLEKTHNIAVITVIVLAS